MVTEISAPDGYDICETPYIITLKAGESASETLLMEDPEKGMPSGILFSGIVKST